MSDYFNDSSTGDSTDDNSDDSTDDSTISSEALEDCHDFYMKYKYDLLNILKPYEGKSYINWKGIRQKMFNLNSMYINNSYECIEHNIETIRIMADCCKRYNISIQLDYDYYNIDKIVFIIGFQKQMEIGKILNVIHDKIKCTEIFYTNKIKKLNHPVFK